MRSKSPACPVRTRLSHSIRLTRSQRKHHFGRFRADGEIAVYFDRIAKTDLSLRISIRTHTCAATDLGDTVEVDGGRLG